MSNVSIDPSRTIIGVVGAGNMGSGIAQKYATEGFSVVVVDMTDDAAARGQKRVADTLAEGVARKIFRPEQAEAILGRMTFTADRNALVNAALVVEAIFEDKAVKQSLFQALDQICPKTTILATNTSSFYVEDMLAGLAHPERVVGLHYFYHPAKNRLVEVIRSSKTSDDVFARAWRIQELTGKTPIESKDAPGFIVNRFFVPWLNESMRLVQEGVADIPTVEQAAKEAFGVGMGPFELMNVTGVPITLHAATTLGEELGPFYAPCDLIRPIVDEKRNWDLSGTPDTSRFAAVADRLWGVIAQIACQIVFDEKVCTLEDCDLGARVGLRWPVGPFEAINQMGSARALARVQQVAARYADIEVPASLAQHGSEDRPFGMRFVQVRVEEGVGYITLNRPDAMNALNEMVVRQIGEAFECVSQDPNTRGIVIEGRGKAFVAGADTKFFVDRIEADDVPRIVRFAADGQELFRRIERCEKTVVCALDGLSLGGGSELALACDFIVATERGTLGFPETGIGIYPGLGGTQRSARRVGVPLARWLVFTGDVVPAKVALSLGLIDEVVSSDAFAEALVRRATSGEKRAERAPPTGVPAGHEATAQLFEAPLEQLRTASAPLPEGGDAEKMGKMLKKLGFKAPLALAAADALLTYAKSHTLDEGLAAETEGLDAIFRSQDALSGLSSVGKGRPHFVGA